MREKRARRKKENIEDGVFWRAPKPPIYRCEGVNGMG